MKVIRKGFTLIELLVVISVIALLLSILTPALQKVKSQALYTVCGNNIKQNVTALLIYGTDNDELLPPQSMGDWLHDVSYYTTDMIIELGGGGKHSFYCPSTKKWDSRGDNPLYWQWSQSWDVRPNVYHGPEPTSEYERRNEYRVVGYFWMMPFVNEDYEWYGRGWEPEGEHTWIFKTTHYSNGAGESGLPVRHAASAPLITDQIFTDYQSRDYLECDFFGSMWGGLGMDYGIPDVTNHAKGTKVDAGNIGFVDSHVKRRSIKDMMRRNDWAPFHWW